MPQLLIDKLKASSIHLFISAFVLFSFLGITYFYIYTPELFIVEGAYYVLPLLIGVDLVLGPVMTFILYRKGKEKLAFDLSIIALVQIIAFVSGAWVLQSERPVYLAYHKDAFMVVNAGRLMESADTPADLMQNIIAGPKLVYVRVLDKKEYSDIMDLVFGKGEPGPEKRQALYLAVKDNLDVLTKKANTLESIEKNNPAELVTQFKARMNELTLSFDDVLILPVTGVTDNITVILDKHSGEFIAFFDQELK